MMSLSSERFVSARTSATLPWWVGFLPCVAVGIGLYGLDSALISVGIYHLGILLLMGKSRGWSRLRSFLFKGGHAGWMLGFVLAGLSSWPVLNLLWPVMAIPGVELARVLTAWKMPDVRGLLVFAIYSCTLHPVLEEGFWRGLMPPKLLGDVLFGFFHFLVLVQIVHLAAAVFCMVVLIGAAFCWRWVAQKTGGLLIPILSHAVADLGIVLFVAGQLSSI